MFSLIETHSNPTSVFVIGTIGDTTTQLSLTSDSIPEHTESIFSYGIDKIKTSLSLATETLSFPEIVPFISPNASFARFVYSTADSDALAASLDPIITSKFCDHLTFIFLGEISVFQ